MTNSLDSNLAKADGYLARFATAPLGHFIAGEADPGRSNALFDNVSPIDDRKLGEVASGGADDIDAAARAADDAFADWRDRPGKERKALLHRIADLIEAEPVDGMLNALHEDPGPSELERLRPAIDRLFAGASVESILQALDDESGEHADWAHAVAADIRQKSPLSLKVAFRQMQDGARMSLDEAEAELARAAAAAQRLADIDLNARITMQRAGIARNRGQFAEMWRVLRALELSDDFARQN